jgi:hypothetical protein
MCVEQFKDIAGSFTALRFEQGVAGAGDMPEMGRELNGLHHLGKECSHTPVEKEIPVVDG